jgi:hypothetical protein
MKLARNVAHMGDIRKFTHFSCKALREESTCDTYMYMEGYY